jgi:hypothetical protein
MAGRGLIRIVVFFALTALAAWQLDFLIDTGMRRIRTAEFGSYNRALYGNLNPEIVVSGSSRAVLQYDPRVLSRVTGRSAFNIGRVGSHVDMQLALLKVFLRRNRPPRLQIQNVDYGSVARTVDREFYAPVQYAPYIGEPEIYAAIRRFHPSVWRWKYLPLYRYTATNIDQQWRFGVRALLGQQPPDSYVDGFFARWESLDRSFDELKARSQPFVYTPEAEAVRDLEEIIEISQARGSTVVFVFSPVYHEYASKVQNGRNLIATSRSIAERHGIAFLDYSDSPLGMTRANFRDYDHMNGRGAALFSEELAARLKTLLESSAVP